MELPYNTAEMPALSAFATRNADGSLARPATNRVLSVPLRSALSLSTEGGAYDDYDPDADTAPVPVVGDEVAADGDLPDAPASVSPDSPYIWPSPAERQRKQKADAHAHETRRRRQAGCLIGPLLCVTLLAGYFAGGVLGFGNRGGSSTAGRGPVAAATHGATPTNTAPTGKATATPGKKSTPIPAHTPTVEPDPTATPSPTTPPPASGNTAYDSSGDNEYDPTTLAPISTTYVAPGTKVTFTCVETKNGVAYARLSDGNLMPLTDLSRKQDQFDPLNASDYRGC